MEIQRKPHLPDYDPKNPKHVSGATEASVVLEVHKKKDQSEQTDNIRCCIKPS